MEKMEVRTNNYQNNAEDAKKERLFPGEGKRLPVTVWFVKALFRGSPMFKHRDGACCTQIPFRIAECASQDTPAPGFSLGGCVPAGQGGQNQVHPVVAPSVPTGHPDGRAAEALPRTRLTTQRKQRRHGLGHPLPSPLPPGT